MPTTVTLQPRAVFMPVCHAAASFLSVWPGSLFSDLIIGTDIAYLRISQILQVE